MSTTYNVTLALRTEGDLVAKVSKVGDAADKSEKAFDLLRSKVIRTGDEVKRAEQNANFMSSAITTMGSKAGSVFGSMADSIASVSIGMAKWGGAAILGGLVYGVSKLNNELEMTTTSLASIFQAQGLTSTFQVGMSVATDQVAKMKQDVMLLPGTFGQLAQLMQTTATTGIAAGMDEDQLRKFAGRTMLTASIVAPTIDNNLLSKEIVNLLAGKAGTHNILGLRLGLQGEEAKKFNALSPEQRLAELNKIYDKYKDATDAISHSWRAQFTSLKDNVLYQVLQPVTKPLFEHVKADLVKVNDWFVKNRVEIEHFVNIVGYRLAEAWDKVVTVVQSLEPLLQRLGGYLERFNFSDVTSAAKTLLNAYLGLKAASFVAPAMSSMAAPMLSGLMTGAGVTEVAVASFLGAATLAAMAIPAAGLIGNLEDPNSKYHEHSTKAISDAGKFFEMTGFKIKEMWGDIHPLTSELGDVLASSAAGASMALAGVTSALEYATYGAGKFVAFLNGESMEPQVSFKQAKLLGFETGSSYLMTPEERAAAHPKPEARNFGTNIQKVEIVVKGSDDPSRVARVVLEKIQQMTNHSTSSKFAARP